MTIKVQQPEKNGKYMFRVLINKYFKLSVTVRHFGDNPLISVFWHS